MVSREREEEEEAILQNKQSFFVVVGGPSMHTCVAPDRGTKPWLNQGEYLRTVNMHEKKLPRNKS